MKKVIFEEEGEGLVKLLGQEVLLMCNNYFYIGTLVGVNSDCVLLTDASIVYETGAWANKDYQDAQKLGFDVYVMISHIEAFGVGKRSAMV